MHIASVLLEWESMNKDDSADTPGNRISREQVALVARLARLDLSDEELDQYTDQLCAVLDHAAQVSSIDTSSVSAASNPLSATNVVREDRPAACIDRDEVLSMAPEAQDGMFKVPRIMEDEP